MTLPIYDPDTDRTEYLPAQRIGYDRILDQQRRVLEAHAFSILDELPLQVYVVNGERQIVWLNRQARDSLGATDVIGYRPGEALGCVHAGTQPGGCGTSLFCRYCAAPSAILRALGGTEGADECVIERGREYQFDALNLLVWSAPLVVDDERFALLTVSDISAKRRQEVLERLFYHDIGNTITGIKAMVELLSEELGGQQAGNHYLGLLDSATGQLLDEVASQKLLKQLDEGRVEVSLSQVHAEQLVAQVCDLFRYGIFGRDIELVQDCKDLPLLFNTDPVLLRRVLVNMLKNAIEASSRGDRIEVGCRLDGEVVFWVQNPAVMGEEARLRVFQRAFSTKGRGRGLGSFGMKLLTEEYLHGHIGFRSEPGFGTRFELRLPLSMRRLG